MSVTFTLYDYRRRLDNQIQMVCQYTQTTSQSLVLKLFPIGLISHVRKDELGKKNVNIRMLSHLMSLLLIVRPIMPVNNQQNAPLWRTLFPHKGTIDLMAHLFRITSVLSEQMSRTGKHTEKTGQLCSPAISHNITSSHTTAFCFLLPTCIRFKSESVSTTNIQRSGCFRNDREIQHLRVKLITILIPIKNKNNNNNFLYLLILLI